MKSVLPLQYFKVSVKKLQLFSYSFVNQKQLYLIENKFIYPSDRE